MGHGDLKGKQGGKNLWVLEILATWCIYYLGVLCGVHWMYICTWEGVCSCVGMHVETRNKNLPLLPFTLFFETRSFTEWPIRQDHLAAKPQRSSCLHFLQSRITGANYLIFFCEYWGANPSFSCLHKNFTDLSFSPDPAMSHVFFISVFSPC